MTENADLGVFEALETSLLHPDVRGSRERLDALLAPEFVEFGRSGKNYTRSEIIEFLADESAEALGQVTVSGFAARALSETVVLVTYISSRQGPTDPRPRRTNRSSIWTRIDGRWLLAFHQGTPVPDPFR